MKRKKFEMCNIYFSIKNNRPQFKANKCIDETKTPEACFYKTYDPYEGALTAIVLGGFFAFVCLLVMYKTKCKPMWKNRRKRLTTTPATASVAEIEEQVAVGGGTQAMLNPDGAANGPPIIQQEFDEDECQVLSSSLVKLN